MAWLQVLALSCLEQRGDRHVESPCLQKPKAENQILLKQTELFE